MRWLRIPLGGILVLVTAWCAAALWIDGPASRLGAGLLAAVVAVGSLAALALLRPFHRGALVSALLCALTITWWLGIEPSNDRDWTPDVARLPTAQLEGDALTVQNVRNFDYRSETDFVPHWETRRYDLRKLQGVDFFVIHWGSPMIAHTIVSWVFEDAPPLAVSIETRKEKGEEYSAVLGFFRQFELYYVVADERDLIGLRTNYRGEDVYLYRLTTPLPVARALLLDYVAEINRLALNPTWYNALTQNCTTTIRHHVKHIAPGNRLDWRILVNGYIDELGYERGTIDTSVPFDELKQRGYVNERARSAPLGSDFWRRIREGVPVPPGR